VSDPVFDSRENNSREAFLLKDFSSNKAWLIGVIHDSE
jgi:hypothetical protein